MPTSDSTSGPLNDQLADLAAVIPVDQVAESLGAVRGTATSRRRRRNAVGGCIAAAALVAGGVVVLGAVSDGDGSDTIAIEGLADTVPADTTAVTTGGQAAPGEGEDAATGPTEAVTPGVVSVPTRQVAAISPTALSISLGVGDAAATDMVEWIVPWQGGFLAASASYVPTPLPAELPEEIIALFPPEVVEFFNGELPPTIDEATTMLSEAGLLDEVVAVLDSNPEAAAAIYGPGSELPGPETEVVFSADGIDWEPIDFVFPEGLTGLYGVQSTGTRLAVAVQQPTEIPPSGVGFPDQTAPIVVATTTDLITWELAEVETPARPEGLPDVIAYGVSANGLAINDVGWMLPVDVYAQIDIESLLPDDLLGDARNGGYGTNWDDDGVQIDLYGGPVETVSPGGDGGDDQYGEPAPSETLTFTWDELGIGADARDLLINGPGTRQLFAASWGGAPVEVDNIDAWTLAAGRDGFYASSGDSIMHSVDGTTWTEIPLPDGVFYGSTIKALPEGIIVLASDELGTSMVLHLANATAEWERLEIPGAPMWMSDIFGGTVGSGVAMIVDATPQEIPEPVDITVESDGYTMLMQTNLSKTSVRVTDSDGAVVAEATHDWRDGVEPTLFRHSNDGIEILDADGEVIVTFGNDVMSAAYEEQFGEIDQSMDEYSPDLWLVATADAERWLVKDLDFSMDDARFGPDGVVVSGNILLVNAGGGWDRYDLS